MKDRLLALNHFTAKQIEYMSGEKVDKGIVCVGNTIVRKMIENRIIDCKPVVIIGPANSGKLTAVLEICERNKIDFIINYDGSDFGNLPFSSDKLFIIRNPKKNAQNKEYIDRDLRVCFLFDNAKDNFANVSPYQILPPTSTDKAHYKNLKGMDMIHENGYSNSENERLSVAKLLKSTSNIKGDIPNNTHLYYAMNFNTKKGILKVCNYAQDAVSPLLYWGFMNLIKYPRSIELKPITWVKTHDSSDN